MLVYILCRMIHGKEIIINVYYDQAEAVALIDKEDEDDRHQFSIVTRELL